MKKTQHDSQSLPKILGHLSLVIFVNCIFIKKRWKRNGDVLIVALEAAIYVTPFL